MKCSTVWNITLWLFPARLCWQPELVPVVVLGGTEQNTRVVTQHWELEENQNTSWNYELSQKYCKKKKQKRKYKRGWHETMCTYVSLFWCLYLWCWKLLKNIECQCSMLAFFKWHLKEKNLSRNHFKPLTALIPHMTVVLPCFTIADPSAVVIEPRNFIRSCFIVIDTDSPFTGHVHFDKRQTTLCLHFVKTRKYTSIGSSFFWPKKKKL